ncbi:hypothetical protein FJY68_01200 [candidate division WOR-3 bacterium]|uniref:Uncharacterized protein n=1 Tax=candidate division WOR-3 bacterium TaxID=2052148 RepID=A0A938BSA8_UNCW3|nr:hypothetical protein [candidate division WOR-3 bacterium]
MKGSTSKLVVVLLVAFGSTMALVRAFHTEPVSVALSGWTGTMPPNNYVSQVLTINFDELDSTAGAYCELFAGTQSGGGPYHVSVKTYPGSAEVASASQDGHVDHKWVRFNLNVLHPESIVKGKKLEFRFTRGVMVPGESFQFYYDSVCGYNYGFMIAPTLQSVPVTAGLAMRVYGRMKPVSDVWRACHDHGDDPPFGSDSALSALVKAKSMGVKWLRDDFLCWGSWDSPESLRGKIKSIYNRYDSMGFNMVGILCYGSDDSTKSSGPPGSAGSWGKYPPRNLFADVHSDTNWWAGYCRSIMENLPLVKYWEVFPEANAEWYWKDPDIAYYQGRSGLCWDTIDTPIERCSLYVRMCVIAESVAHESGGGRKIIGGAPWRLRDPWWVDGDTTCCPGVIWLEHVFELAERAYGGMQNCLDIVSVHPYMWTDSVGCPNRFSEDEFTICLDTARRAMREAGHPDMELWATEYGWPRWRQLMPDSLLTDTLVQADNICKFYTSAIARQADPRGGYDRATHYELTSLHHPDADNQGFGLLDREPSQHLMPHGWAFTQESFLTGKRLNGRVITGDTAVDDHTRVYEFEDTTALKKRTWVCWQDEAVAAYTPVPVRNDTVDTVALAYNGSPPADEKDAEQSGWLHIALDPRPAFVMEKTVASRPDLVVDSVRYFQPPDTIAVRAWVTNSGNRSTPLQQPGEQPFPTWAVLYANGDSIAQVVYTGSIAVSEQVLFEFGRGAVQMPQTALLAVRVNPGQSYVELGTGDNRGYRLKPQP